MVPGTKLYRLYAALPPQVQNLFVSTYGWVLHRRRYGSEHEALLAQLLETQSWDLDRIRDLEWERTRDLVAYAYTQVPHYREAWKHLDFHPEDLKSWDDFRRLPITEKDTVKEDPFRFVADSWRESKKLLVGNTSGTTGKPLRTVKVQSVHQAVWAFQERQRRVWGLLHERPRATIHNRLIVPQEQSRPPFWRYNFVEKQWLFSNLHLRSDYLDSYLDKLADLGVEEINGYPSAISAIAAHAIERGDTRVRPKAVITLAETVYEHQRQLVERAFGCPIADQYGSAEVVVWVGQCPKGTYHVNHEFGHLETVIGSESVLGQPGDVVGTGFVNRVQVLIRYRLGDQAVLSPEAGNCACGWQTAHLASIVGRIDDVFYMPDGRPLGRLDLVAKGLPGVRESQLVQDREDHITIRLVASDHPSELSAKTATDRLRGFVGDAMGIDVTWLDEIPRSKAGKYRFQINEAGRPPSAARCASDRS